MYLGKVISVEERPFASGTRQWREHVTTLQVLRAWIKNPPTTITVRGLQMSIGYDEHCVKSALPKDGEEWLVVAHPDPNGVLQAEQLMSLNMETTNGEAGVAVIKKTLGNGYDPKVQANKPLEPTR